MDRLLSRHVCPGPRQYHGAHVFPSPERGEIFSHRERYTLEGKPMTEEGRTIKTYGQAPLCRGTGPSGRRASSASKRRSRNGFRAVSLRRHLTAFFLLFCAAAVTGAAPAPGSIDVLYEGGSREIEFRLTTASGMLRIEQVSPSSSPAPIHLVDLTSGDVTIVNRFNRTVLTHAQTASAEPEDEHPDPRGSSATTPPDLSLIHI